jgi:hypothetical protein
MERAERRGFKIVAIYALICAGIFLLQLFPLTGGFLMFLMAAAWIGVVINVAMIHLAGAALIGSIARLWIAMPLAFYVGGFAAHYWAAAEVRTQAQAIEQDNAAAVVTAGPPLSFFVKGVSTEFVELYRVDRLVLPQGNRPPTIYYYARGTECDSANNKYDYRKRDEPFLFRRDLFFAYKGADKTRQCILQKDGPPGEVHYRIEAVSFSSETPLIKSFGTKWTVYDAQTGGLLTKAESAAFRVITPFPFLLAGCGLVDNPASWRCDAGTMKESTHTGAGYRPDDDGGFSRSRDPQTWELAPLGRALSLQPRQPTD